jgi:phage terminase small subunit
VPDDLDEIDDFPEERELIPFASEKQATMDKAIAGRMKGKPNYPYPVEMKEHFRPYWLELVNSFEEGFFHPADVPILKLYCRCAHDIERCNQLIEEEGDVIMGSKGPMVNPRVKVRSAAEAVLLNLTTKLRAQPASRGNSTEFQRNDAKAANRRHGDQVIDEDEELLLGAAERRGQAHTLN